MREWYKRCEMLQEYSPNYARVSTCWFHVGLKRAIWGAVLSWHLTEHLNWRDRWHYSHFFHYGASIFCCLPLPFVDFLLLEHNFQTNGKPRVLWLFNNESYAFDLNFVSVCCKSFTLFECPFLTSKIKIVIVRWRSTTNCVEIEI